MTTKASNEVYNFNFADPGPNTLIIDISHNSGMKI